MAVFAKGGFNGRAFGKGLSRAGSIVSKGARGALKVANALDKAGVTAFVPGAAQVRGALQIAGAVGEAAEDVGNAIAT
jgi:hypothetical protein